jgi:hypothetical protein
LRAAEGEVAAEAPNSEAVTAVERAWTVRALAVNPEKRTKERCQVEVAAVRRSRRAAPQV